MDVNWCFMVADMAAAVLERQGVVFVDKSLWRGNVVLKLMDLPFNGGQPFK